MYWIVFFFKQNLIVNRPDFVVSFLINKRFRFKIIIIIIIIIIILRYCPFLYTQSLSLSFILSFVKFFLLCLIRAPSQSVWTWQLILHTLSLLILMGPAWLNFWGFIGDYLPTGSWRFKIIILKKEVSEGKLQYRRESEQSSTQSDFPMTL